jgi:hypothetical protein
VSIYTEEAERQRHTPGDGCKVCIICGKHKVAPKHVDTCGERCFKRLLERQRQEIARPAGFQPGTATIGGFMLWCLHRDIPGHPKGSTVSERTLAEYLKGEKE